MFKKLFVVSAAFFCFGTASIASAQQCTGTAATSLLACSHLSAESCRATAGCVNDITQSLSAQNVIEAAATKCCALSSNRRRTCLNSYGNRLNLARLRAPLVVSRFLTRARSGVLELRTNGCSTGTLGE